jgi:hypothetical protein
MSKATQRGVLTTRNDRSVVSPVWGERACGRTRRHVERAGTGFGKASGITVRGIVKGSATP